MHLCHAVACGTQRPCRIDLSGQVCGWLCSI
nr:MAG TPA: hypothetical protein [Caudoviricetes sp.]